MAVRMAPRGMRRPPPQPPRPPPQRPTWAAHASSAEVLVEPLVQVVVVVTVVVTVSMFVVVLMCHVNLHFEWEPQSGSQTCHGLICNLMIYRNMSRCYRFVGGRSRRRWKVAYSLEGASS